MPTRTFQEHEARPLGVPAGVPVLLSPTWLRHFEARPPAAQPAAARATTGPIGQVLDQPIARPHDPGNLVIAACERLRDRMVATHGPTAARGPVTSPIGHGDDGAPVVRACERIRDQRLAMAGHREERSS